MSRTVPGRMVFRPMASAALIDDDSPTIQDDHLTSKGRLQMLLREHLLGPAHADKTRVQQRHLVETSGREIKIMSRDKHRDRTGTQPGQQLESGLSRTDIHPGKGFIEQKHVRLLRQSAGEKDPLLLPS